MSDEVITDVQPRNDKRGHALRMMVGLLDENDLAAMLGLKSTDTLATWRSRSEGPPPTKLGKRVFYRVDDIVMWVQARGGEAPAVAKVQQDQQENAA